MQHFVSGLNGPVWPVEDFEQMEKQFGKPKAPFIISMNNPLRLNSQDSSDRLDKAAALEWSNLTNKTSTPGYA